MRRRLILMRHATAGSTAGRDHDRPLTARGHDEAKQMGDWLRAEGLRPDRVLVSTARRCRETWQAVAIGLGESAPSAAAVDFEDPLYNASLDGLLAAVRQTEGAKTLLLIAHNPGISLLALELGRDAGADEARLREGFTPATTATFLIDGDWSGLASTTTRLERLERPASLDPVRRDRP